MSIRKAAKSVSLLWAGSLIGSGSTFVVYIILARELGAEKFGIFGSAFSMATIFTIFASFGVSQLWLKLFGQHGWNSTAWIPASLRFLIVIVSIMLVFLFGWGYFGPHGETTRHILFIMSLFIVGQVGIELVSSKFQLEERYNSLALWQLLPNLSRLIIIAFLMYVFSFSIDVIDVAWVYGLVGALFLGLAAYQISQLQNGHFNLAGHNKKPEELPSIQPKLKDVFSEAWPFGMASFFAFVYVQSDIIMVKYIAGDTEAGYYNVAFVILTAIMIFPTVLYQKFFLPKYHRWANHDREKFYSAYKKGNLAMLFSGSIVMVVLLLLAGWGVPFVFGSEYQNSVILTKILAITIPIYFIAYSVGATLVTKKHMKLKVKLMGVTALVNIVLNTLLIPLYQAEGAAIATLASNILLLFLYYLSAQKIVFTLKKENNVATN